MGDATGSYFNVFFKTQNRPLSWPQMDMQHDLIVARDEGEAAKAIAIAKNAIQMDMPIETIVKLTGLTRAEVEGLCIAN